MRILLCNDDGVDAPGLWALYQEVRQFAETLVVAPATERSAVGHAISVYNHVALRKHTRETHDWGYGLDGTPADCVKMALTVLMKENPPDLVISGINRGQNTGTSILYSGTVAAALEATMNGFPAIAISLAICDPFKGGKSNPTCAEEGFYFRKGLARTPADYAAAARFAAHLAKTVAQNGLPKGVLLNVNVPLIPDSDLRGAEVSKMGQSLFLDDFQITGEEDGATHYRNMGEIQVPSPTGEAWDDLVLVENKISVTPLHYDLTHHQFMEQLKGWDFGTNALAEAGNSKEAGAPQQDLESAR